MTYLLDKIGSDAELFVLKEGKPHPICGIVGGTKEEPLPVLGGNGFAVQEDNVMLEFNIPASQSAKEFGSNIGTMLAHLAKEMKKKELVIVGKSSMVFPLDLLQSEQAKKFGCQPDFCVWNRSVNAPPQPDEISHRYRRSTEKDLGGEIRSAGYHVHVSYTVDGETPSISQIEDLVKAQDLFLGLPAVLLDEYPTDRLPRRKWLYGRAGCFRPKDYGHEYRVLGSKLLSAHPNTHEWIFNQTVRAIEFVNQNEGNLKHVWDGIGGVIQEAINSSDISCVQSMMNNYLMNPPPGIPQMWQTMLSRSNRYGLTGIIEEKDYLQDIA